MRLNRFIFALLLFLLLPRNEVEAKRVRVSSFEDFISNNTTRVTFIVSKRIDCKGKLLSLYPGSKIIIKEGGSFYNASIVLNGKSLISGGHFFLVDGCSINDFIIVRGGNNIIRNCTIDGSGGHTRFGISCFNAPRTRIEKVEIKNIGNGENNTAGIRVDGDCSHSNLNQCSIVNINAFSNASGILVQQNTKEASYSTNIIMDGCKIENIIPVLDGDGVKILQNHLPAKHIIRNCLFINCAKRAIKIQGTGVKCLDNYVSGGCNESVIDYQNGDCFISGLLAENLKYVYAALYIQGSEGSVYIKKVKILANNTGKQYVRGIKIKKASWDNDHPITDIFINNSFISDFYIALSIEGFSKVNKLTLNKCEFSSVGYPIHINTEISNVLIDKTVDYQLDETRASVYYPQIEKSKHYSVSIEKKCKY